VPLDPVLAALAIGGTDAPPPPADRGERRAAANAGLMLAHTGPEPGVGTADHTIPVPGGEITVRVYRPDGLASPMPAFLYLHGGGWFQGNLDTAEVEMGPMASLTPCLVASVDYRLAPECPFPIALEDCIAAYEWLIASSVMLGVDRTRIAVGGTSAGGNLAAALCIAARDRGLAQPVLQLLDAPGLDLTLGSPSVNEVGGGFGEAELREFIDMYVSDEPLRSNPYVSPLLCDDLSGLAPAVITVAEIDPVRDDGERYLTRLHEAGVPGTCVRVQAMFHIGWVVPLTTTHRLINDFRASALRRAFDGTLNPLV